MPTVTGYRIFDDSGAAGPSPGDGVSGGVETLIFDTDSEQQNGRTTVNYPSYGTYAGFFYFSGGSYYFVPDDSTDFPPNEAGSVQTYTENVYGTSGNDSDASFATTSGDDLVYGGSSQSTSGTGDDSIDGGGGQDTIYSGDGADSVEGGSDDDLIYGGDGDDYLVGDSGNDTLYGEAGNDTLRGGGGNDSLYGGVGDDSLDGDSGDDYLDGGDGSDTLSVYYNEGTDTVVGGNGGSDEDTLEFRDNGSGVGVNITSSGDGAGTYAFDDAASSGSYSGIERLQGTSEDDNIDTRSDNSGLYIDAGAGDDLTCSPEKSGVLS